MDHLLKALNRALIILVLATVCGSFVAPPVVHALTAEGILGNMAFGDPKYGVFVITVNRNKKMRATNGNPPLVNLRINEVLRQPEDKSLPLRKGKTIWSVWASHAFGCGSFEAGRKYMNKVVEGPPSGLKLVIIGYPVTRANKRYLRVAPICRYHYSTNSRQYALDWINAPKNEFPKTSMEVLRKLRFYVKPNNSGAE